MKGLINIIDGLSESGSMESFRALVNEQKPEPITVRFLILAIQNGAFKLRLMKHHALFFEKK